MQSDRLPLKWFSPFPLADGFKGGEKRTEFARDIFSVGGEKKRGSMMLLQLPWKNILKKKRGEDLNKWEQVAVTGAQIEKRCSVKCQPVGLRPSESVGDNETTPVPSRRWFERREKEVPRFFFLFFFSPVALSFYTVVVVGNNTCPFSL